MKHTMKQAQSGRMGAAPDSGSAALARHQQRALLRRAVVVWMADVNTIESLVAEQARDAWQGEWLSAAELARQSRLHFAADRRLFGAAHRFLRWVLSQHAAAAPACWRFVSNALGRPELATRSACRRHRLRFNLSHTHDLVAVALSHGVDVGVDVEHQAREMALDELLPSAISAVERQWFHALAPVERSAAFTGLWTLKESLLKAYGVGIGENLGQLSLLKSWQQPQLVLATPTALPASEGRAHVVLADADGGYALAVSALAALSAVSDPLPETMSPQRRRVLVHDLRPGHAPARLRVCLAVRHLPEARTAPQTSTLSSPQC